MMILGLFLSDLSILQPKSCVQWELFTQALFFRSINQILVKFWEVIRT